MENQKASVKDYRKQRNKQTKTKQNTINRNKTYTVFIRVKCARFIYFKSGIVFIDDDLLFFNQLILTFK